MDARETKRVAMRILLCSSYMGPGQPEPICFPIGLGCIASNLAGHELFCWNPNIEKNPMTELCKILGEFSPDLVGVSLRNVDSVFSFARRSYYDPFVSFIKTIKERAPSSKLIVGGAAFSIFAKEIMERNPEIDFGIVSEGERAFTNLIKNLDHPEKVKNLALRKEGKVYVSDKEEFIDFGSMPSPSREGFDLSKYKKYPYSMGIESKRGCSFACVYCFERFLCGNRYRLRPPQKIVDEMEKLLYEHGISEFFFVDPVFNAPPEHARAICREIKKRKLNIKWKAEFRPDYLNSEFMKEAAESGCQLFDFSPDGASDYAMQVLGKNLRVKDVEKTAEWASKIENAKVAYNFVYDLPAGNTGQSYGLARLYTKIMSSCRCKLEFLSLTKMRIYPQTNLYRVALREGKISADSSMIPPVYYERLRRKNPEEIFARLLRVSSTGFAKLCKSSLLGTRRAPQV
jgi:anaerobic magnesium-protoporphyrin IX monomethyl ester cyclase